MQTLQKSSILVKIAVLKDLKPIIMEGISKGMSMCCFCLGDAVKDMCIGTCGCNKETFCCYKCYDRKYSLLEESENEDE